MEITDAKSLSASKFVSALKDIEGRIADVPLLETCRLLYCADAEWFAANLDQTALPGDLAYSRYVAFQERPLYRLSSGSAVPVASRFLLERTTYGAYWILHKYYREKDPTRGIQRFQGHIGASFQDYATDSLLRCEGNSVVYTEQQIMKCAGDPQGLPDVVIVDGEALIVLEMSATVIPAEVKAAADVRAFRTKATEFGREFTQIDRVIQRLVRGDLSLPALDLSRIRRIYPVLVLSSRFRSFLSRGM